MQPPYIYRRTRHTRVHGGAGGAGMAMGAAHADAPGPGAAVRLRGRRAIWAPGWAWRGRAPASGSGAVRKRANTVNCGKWDRLCTCRDSWNYRGGRKACAFSAKNRCRLEAFRPVHARKSGLAGRPSHRLGLRAKRKQIAAAQLFIKRTKKLLSDLLFPFSLFTLQNMS